MSQSLKMIPNDKPWYAEGLRFQCTECGKCCTGSPGYAWVTEEEIVAIANFLDITLDECSQRFIRRVDSRYALLEMPKTYDCVFLKQNRCTIYPVRPKQCRTYPWWPQNLQSQKDWEEAAKFCEGIQPDAPKVPFEKIEAQLNIQVNH